MRIGLDIGGTKTDAVAIDARGMVVSQLRIPTGYGPDEVLRSAEEAVIRVLELAGIAPSGVESIGVGIPGRVDVETGWVGHAVNLGVDGLNLGGTLSDRFQVPVRVENDVNAAALGAYHRLLLDGWPGDQDHSMGYLNLGTGLAAGIVIAGQLWRGARGTAGEIGHIPVDPSGPLCPCGQRGCLELVASGSAITRLWPTTSQNPAQDLFTAAEGGNQLATEVRQTLLDSVASAVRVLVLTVDVELVVIAGGIASLGDSLLEGVQAVLTQRESESSFLASLHLADRVRLVPADFPSAAIGAALAGVDSLGGIESRTRLGKAS